MKFELWYPVKPKFVNQGFGENLSPIYKQIGMLGHNGIDFMASDKQPVYAASEGVCHPEIDIKGGNGVVVRTQNQYEYNNGQVNMKCIYWHLVQDDAVVKEGQVVKPGELIGYADNTGLSAGTHLHFGLKPQANTGELNWTWYNLEQNNGYLGAIDPAPYFNGFYAEDSQDVITNLQTQITLAQKVINILKKLLAWKS